MFKMTDTGHNHCNTMFIAILESQIVFYGTTRLDNSLYTFFVCQLYAIGEREKRITCHYSTVQIKAK